MNRIQEYTRYHQLSAQVGDIDPSYSLLRYVCDRFELNVEQRYWLAFVYALTYCGASVYYVYNEFPDFENLDEGRLNRWWYGGGREAIICQTDARWRRSRNQFVPAIQSYRNWMDGHTQAEHFRAITKGLDTPEARYNSVYAGAKRNLFTFGQFTLFLYLEALHTITPLCLAPTDLDLNQAWSCRDGMFYAYGMDEHILDKDGPALPESQIPMRETWADLRQRMALLSQPPTVWQIETVLCAYRKYRRTLDGLAGATGKRYIGYYLDRQADEIAKMEDHVKDGVAWRVLWQYREETFPKEFLAEAHGWVSSAGVKAGWKQYGIERTRYLLEEQC